MKKLVAVFIFLIMGAVAVIAQEVEPPSDWGGVIDGFRTWFGTLAGIAAVTIFIAGFLNGLLKVENKTVKQIVAWIVAIVLALIGNLVNLGFLAEATWLMTLLYGLGAGLVANGLFDVAVVHAIILAIESALNKDK